MMTDCPTNASKHAVCDNCQSNFACSRLFISLKIAESDYQKMDKNNPIYQTVGEKLRAIRHHLGELGWEFPHSQKSCKYAFNLSNVWKELGNLTELIHSMSAGKMVRSDLDRLENKG